MTNNPSLTVELDPNTPIRAAAYFVVFLDQLPFVREVRGDD